MDVGSTDPSDNNVVPLAAAHDRARLARAQTERLTPAEHAVLANLQLGSLTLPALIDHLMSALSAVDPDTGELTAELGEAIDRLNLSIERKVEAYGHVALRLKAEGEAFDSLATAYRDKAKQREQARAALRSRLQSQLERLNLERVRTESVTAYLQRSPVAVELTVLTDEEVPDAYCDRVVNLGRIKQALERGEVFGFARLITHRHLRFR